MNTKIITRIVATLALGSIPVIVLAGGFGQGFGRHQPGEGRGEGRMHGGFAKLNLTDDQHAKIKAIHTEVQPAMEELHTKLAEARKGFHAANPPGTFDEKAIRSFVETQSRLEADLMVLTVKTQAKVYELLTPEQQEIFKQMRSHGEGDRGGRGGRGGFRLP